MPGSLWRPDTNNRFVAFAFAASEMMLEADRSGAITYAAGAFRTRLGKDPESFLGRNVSDLIAPSDQDVLRTALSALEARGRLLPCLVRLANHARSPVVLAGLRLGPDRPDSPLCLTIGLPPNEAEPPSQATAAFRLIQAAEARLDMAVPGRLALVEMTGDHRGEGVLATALEKLVPQALASAVAPGRYGLLDPTGTRLGDVLPMLETLLQRQGNQVTISTTQVPLDAEGLTRVQATRTLGQALAVFARDGVAGVDGAGFAGGLAAFVQGAMSQASTLRRAISQRDFRMLYQPIVTMTNRVPHHFEALLRPAHSMAGRSPQEFVTLLETVGLADELDIAVAEMVLESAEPSSLSVAFNVSGYSMQRPAFRERLLALLRGSRTVRDGRLLIEMTETAQVDDLAEAAETARCLRAIGIRFCIDDFGAGAADIRLLRAIPADIVKLDGSFVPGLLHGERERAFVSGMVEIARAAGSTVVAERVETEAEAEALAAIGVTFGQGWLFGRPGPLPLPKPVRGAKRRVELDEEWR